MRPQDFVCRFLDHRVFYQHTSIHYFFAYKMPSIACLDPRCSRTFPTQRGLTYHMRSMHQNANLVTPPRAQSQQLPQREDEDIHFSPNYEPARSSPFQGSPHPPGPLPAQAPTKRPSKSYHPYLMGTDIVIHYFGLVPTDPYSILQVLHVISMANLLCQVLRHLHIHH